MSSCRDQSVRYLRKFGYNVVKLPRAGIRPMMVATEVAGGKLRELGMLVEPIWVSEASVPECSPNDEVANMSGKSSDRLDAKVGIEVLGNLLQAISVDSPEARAQFSRAQSLQFHYRDVRRESISELELGEYLKRGRLSEDNPYVKRYFPRKGKLFVIIDVLLSKQFGVSCFDKDSQQFELDVAAIQQVVSADGEVAVFSESSSRVEFTGPTALPFAFVATQISYPEGGHWRVDGFPRPGKHHLSIEANDVEAMEELWVQGPDGAMLFNDVVDVERAPSTDGIGES